MSEELHIPITQNKEEVYSALLPQLKALLQDEKNFIANVANTMAVLKQAFNFLWVGCYFVSDDKQDQLVLGPFQGPIACTRIAKGKGVCGTAWQKNETIIVPDVEKFEGHIACSSLSKSEIVVPLKNKTGNAIGVLDVDSEHLNHFDTIDKKYLEQIVEMLAASIDG